MAGPDLKGLVNSDLLSWARKQARLSLEDAARKLGHSPEKLGEWETGASTPTLSQLRNVASVYKRSVGVFFLREIPRVPRRPVDYRRLDLSSTDEMSSALAIGIRSAEAKREFALEIFADMEEEPPAWTFFFPRGSTHEECARLVRDQLRISFDDRSGWRNDYDALNGWKAAVEGLGVLIVQVSGVPLEEMRGCALAHYPLPVIVLNSADSPLGRVFTLLHELAHLARSESGLCDLLEGVPRQSDRDRIEVFCNYVAGAVLVPSEHILADPVVASADETTEWSDAELKRLRRSYWASREVVLRRLLINRKTSPEFYRAMRERFVEEYRQRREQGRGGPVPQFRKVLTSNGRYLTRLAIDAYSARVITGTELSRILDSKLDHLPKIREALSQGVVE